MKNQKGVVETAFLLVSIALGLIISVPTYITYTKGELSSPDFSVNGFRARKAIEQCVSNIGDEQGCINTVSNMTDEQILAYIKDDKISTDRGFEK